MTGKVWHRYGIIGLGLIAPLVTGIVLWSVVLTLAVVLGAAALGIG